MVETLFLPSFTPLLSKSSFCSQPEDPQRLISVKWNNRLTGLYYKHSDCGVDPTYLLPVITRLLLSVYRIVVFVICLAVVEVLCSRHHKKSCWAYRLPSLSSLHSSLHS